jgi:hypothetical protein
MERPLLRAQLRGQREAMVAAVAGLLAWVALSLLKDSESGRVLLALLVGVAALLSPVLAFVAERSTETLAVQLAVQSRRQVLLRLGFVSAASTFALCVLAPCVLLLAAGASLREVLSWSLMVAVLWSFGLAVAVHFEDVGCALSAGLGLVLALVLSNGALLMGTARLLGQTELGFNDPLVVGSLWALVVAALAIARRRFLRAERLEPQAVLWAASFVVANAVLLGALSRLRGG